MKKTALLLALALVLTGCARAPQVPTAATEAATLPTTSPVETTLAVETTGETTAPETEPQPERFLLTFVGDCTLGANPGNYYADTGFIKTVGEDMVIPSGM